MSSYEERLKKKGTLTLPTNPKVFKKGDQFSEEDIHPEYSDIIPRDLIEIENQIQKLNTKTWEVGWLIGKRLKMIRESLLSETGYDNIHEYAEVKFGLKKRTTYNYIFLADNFSKVQSIALGSKLFLLEPLEADKRNEYLTWIENDSPTRTEIIEKIKSDKQSPSRQSQDDINIFKTKMTVNFKKMGVNINRDKQDEFLNKLKELISKYSV